MLNNEFSMVRQEINYATKAQRHKGITKIIKPQRALRRNRNERKEMVLIKNGIEDYKLLLAPFALNFAPFAVKV
jgi:hypothetical protein